MAATLRERFSRCLDVFVPPAARSSPEDRRRARFAIGIALALTPVMMVLAVAQLAWGNPQGALGSAAIGAVLALAPPLYRRWGRLGPIVHGVLAFGWIALCFIAISSRGVGINAATVGLAELPLFAALLTGIRGGAVWAAISCATEIGLAALARADRLVERVPAQTQPLVDYSALLVITLTLFSVGVMYEVRRRQALADLSEQERALRDSERRKAQAETDARLAHAEKLASIGRVTAAIAHEINNPLSYVSVNLTFVGEQLESPDHDRNEVAQALADASDGAARIAHLVARLRSYVRGDGEAPEAGATHLAEALDRAIKVAGPHTRARAAVRCQVEELPPARGSERALVQVFVNLIVNAAQALPEERAGANEIAVHARRSGDWLVVEVRDNGPGIPSDILPRIGQPFFTTKPVGEGTGLGLAVCKTTIRNLGGRFELESEPGRTVARVSLLIADPGEATVAGAPAGRIPAAALPRLRILIVDDDEPVARSLRRILSAHDLTVVGGGAEALEVLSGRADFDLILCDLMMPGMSGMDLHRALSQSHADLVERITFLTGGAFTEKAREFCEQHAASVLRKPVSLAQLDRILVDAASARSPAARGRSSASR